MNLFEHFDDIDYFITDNQERLGLQNMYRLRLVLMFGFAMGSIYVPLYFIFCIYAQIHLVYLLFPVFSGLLWKLSVRIGKKSRLTMRFVRMYAGSCYLFFFCALMAVELVFRTEREAVVFAVALIASVVCYVDRLRYVVSFHATVSLIFLIFDRLLKSRSQYTADFMLVTGALLISLFCYFVMLCGMTSAAQGNRELRHRSTTDLLTGLYNKIAFEEAVRDFLKTRTMGTPCALIIFDFDNFKQVNDSFGHQTGDEVLKYFGQLLHKNFREKDFVGRVGGDEFMVLMTGAVPGGYIEQRCDGILFELRGRKIGDAEGFSASIGIAEDEGGADFERLYAAADHALYQAKKNGKGCYVSCRADIRGPRL